ncbi:hypothetical protein Lal_00014910 [Lupinus albus]|nr:hypothetical protein Lal_00014910 [Lupinus albus]
MQPAALDAEAEPQPQAQQQRRHHQHRREAVQPPRHAQQPLDDGPVGFLGQVHVDSRQVEQAGEPRGDEDDVQRFDPEVHAGPYDQSGSGRTREHRARTPIILMISRGQSAPGNTVLRPRLFLLSVGRRQAFQPDRSARVQLVVRDADLRTEAVLETVGEARRRVDHHGGRVDFAQEAHRVRVVLGDDGVRVLRRVLVDVLDGRVDAVDDLHGEDRCQVFRAPVFFRRRRQVRIALQDRQRFRVRAQFHFLRRVQLGQLRQHGRRDGARDEQRLHRVARAVAVRLRVHRDAKRLGDVRLRVDVDVADAVQVLDHRDGGFLHQARDQALAAARDDDVHEFRHRDEGADGGAVRRLDDLHPVLRQAGAAQAFGDERRERAVAVDGFRTAAQDGGVAALDAQAGRVDRHVRARFVDDADDAQRHAHAAHLDARRAELEVRDFADRVGQRDDLAQAVDHRGDGLVGQRQAVQQRRFQAGGSRRFHVARVGGAEHVGVAFDGGRDQQQGLVAGGAVRARHAARGGAGLAAHCVHGLGDVHRASSVLRNIRCAGWAIDAGGIDRCPRVTFASCWRYARAEGRPPYDATLNASCSIASHASPANCFARRPLTILSTCAACCSAASSVGSGMRRSAGSIMRSRGPQMRYSFSSAPSGRPCAIPAFNFSSHAHEARRVAGQHRFRQFKNVVARDVQHGINHLIVGQLARFVQQGELLDFLVRRQQIALDAVGDEVEALAVRALVLGRETHADPPRQLRAFHVRDLDVDRGLLQRRHPRRLGRLPVQLRQGDQGQVVGVQVLRVVLQGGAAVLARLAAGDAQLDQLLVAEQRHGLVGGQQLAPFEVALDREHVALGIPLRARRAADLVRRFQRKQVLVAGDHVEGREPLGEVPVERLRPQLHGGPFSLVWLGRRLDGSKAADDLLHEVRLHVAVQQRFFRFLGQHLGLVERHVPAQRDLRGRHQFRALRVAHGERHRVRQQVFAHAAQAVQRQDGLVARLGQQHELRLGIRRLVGDDHLVRRAQVALELRAQRGRVREAQVNAVERHRVAAVRAAQLEAAARDGRCHQQGRDRAHRQLPGQGAHGLHHDVDQFTGDDDDLLRRAFDELLRGLRRQRGGFDGGLVGILRHLDRPAQLAVHLDHQLDLGLFQRGRIHFRPAHVQDVAVLARVAQRLPQRVRDVRRDRVQHAQEDRQAFRDHGVACRAFRQLRRLQGIEHLHARRDDRVVLDALEVVVGLLQHLVHFAAQRLLRFVQGARLLASQRGGHALALRISERPHAAQEAARAFHARFRPLQRLLRRRGEHREQAGGIRAVLPDLRLRVDAVVLRLRHLLGAADDDRLAVFLQHRRLRAAAVVEREAHVGRVVPRLLAARVFAVVGLVEHHALGQQVDERLVEFHEAEVAHDLRPEARVQQVQHGVLDAADVLVHRHPVIVARGVDHRVVRTRRRIAHVVPGRVDERVHRVRLAACGRTAARAVDLQERLVFLQRVAGAVRDAVFRQHDRQVLLGNRHGAALLAVDHRDRRAPVALARDAPVAQAERDLLVAQAQVREVARDGVDGRRVIQAVVLARVDDDAAFLVAVPLLPAIQRERLAFDSHHLLDRQVVFFREAEVALVVRRHAHHGAVAVRDQHVVADPDRHLLAGDRVRDEQARGHALLFHRRHVGFDDGTLLALGDERLQFRIVLGRVLGQGVFRRDGAERDAHDRVGARREHVQLAVVDELTLLVHDHVREREAHARRLADPVRLHDAHALRPARQLVLDVVQQFVRVVRDAHVVHRDLALLDGRARAPATAVDDLLVREHGLVDRVPVHGTRLLVDDALLEHLQEHPLVPLVVVRLAGRHFARPVDGEAHRLHLAAHVGDVRVGPLRGRHVVRHRRVLGGHAERVPAHRHQHVVAVHPQVAVHHVIDRIVAHVTHVQLARRIGQHRAGVVLAFRETRIVLDGLIGVDRFPVGLRGLFDFGWTIFFLHDVLRTERGEQNIIPVFELQRRLFAVVLVPFVDADDAERHLFQHVRRPLAQGLGVRHDDVQHLVLLQADAAHAVFVAQVAQAIDPGIHRMRVRIGEAECALALDVEAFRVGDRGAVELDGGHGNLLKRSPRRLIGQETCGAQRALGVADAAAGFVADLDALADAGKQDGVVAHDVAAAHGGKADRRRVALARHAFAAVDGAFLQVAAEGVGDHFAHLQRRARRGVDLVAVLHRDVDADAHVRGEQDRGLGGGGADGGLAGVVEAGRADDQLDAARGAVFQVAQRAFRAREVDQVVGVRQALVQVGLDHDARQLAGKRTGVGSDERRAVAVEGTREDGVRRGGDGFDQHAAHAAARAGDGDFQLGHVIVLRRLLLPRRTVDVVAFRRQVAAVEVVDLVVLEVDGDAARGQFAVAARQVERVIPAILVEGVLQQRRAQDEFHLVAGLAGLHLVQHLLRHEVTLLDVRPVRREDPEEFLQLGDGRRLRARIRDCRGLAGIGGDRVGGGAHRRRRLGLVTPGRAAGQCQRHAGEAGHERCPCVGTMKNGFSAHI